MVLIWETPPDSSGEAGEAGEAGEGVGEGRGHLLLLLVLVLVLVLLCDRYSSGDNTVVGPSVGKDLRLLLFELVRVKQALLLHFGELHELFGS